MPISLLSFCLGHCLNRLGVGLECTGMYSRVDGYISEIERNIEIAREIYLIRIRRTNG